MLGCCREIYGTGLEALFIAIASAFTAQCAKFLLHLITKKEIDLTKFTTTGGMPSSHSAGVVALAVMVGVLSGFTSVDFALATGLALVVMYDASGVRRAAGKQAACLNKIIQDFYKHDVAKFGGRLKELLGHTPLQVVMGALYGVAFALGVHYWLTSICK